MLNRANVVVLIFVIAVLVYFSWWASLGFPHEITTCEQEAADKCPTHYPPVGAIRWILFQLDRYGVLLTAIFTGFIAWFTLTLRRSTDRMWVETKKAAGAAQKSAEGLTIIEGSYVYPVILKTNIRGTFTAFSVGGPEVKQRRIVLEWEFKNFGKSPAIIHRLDAQMILQRRGVTTGVGLGLAPVDRAVIATQRGTGRRQAVIKEFTREDYEAATSDGAVLRFYGAVVYSDIFGDEWAFYFDWTYSHALGRFMPDNQPRRKTEKSSPGR